MQSGAAHAWWSLGHATTPNVVEMGRGKCSTVYANKLRAYRARADQIRVIYHEDDDFSEVDYTPRMNVGDKGTLGGSRGVPGTPEPSRGGGCGGSSH